MKPSRSADAGEQRQETITVSVGPCFGFCPVYDVSISPEGAVTFNGKRHTAVLGERRRDGGRESYVAVARELAEYRPPAGATVAVSCGAAITDTSEYRISWTDSTGQQTVATHHKGCSSGPGQALDQLLTRLPAQLGVDGWAAQITRPGESRG